MKKNHGIHKTPGIIPVRKAGDTDLGLKILISPVWKYILCSIMYYAVLLNEEQWKEMMFSIWPSYFANKYTETSNTSCEP